MKTAVRATRPDRRPRTGAPASRPVDAASRCVVLASADAELRARVRDGLLNVHWDVREAGGGAEALALLRERVPDVLLLDDWLPDLDARELEGMIPGLHPGMDLLRLDGRVVEGSRKSLRRDELLHVLRAVYEGLAAEKAGGTHTAAGTTARESFPLREPLRRTPPEASPGMPRGATVEAKHAIPELVGESAPMMELRRLIRLVAPRSTSVLIEGETGTGKEVVAQALHRFSAQASRPLVVVNCAAIPESLLEAELFGHTRGAFTGAVGARTGRIEAAHGGTLFLDEIGELPLALQAKLLRFLECGEVQRLGENEVAQVEVRVLAATHHNLDQRASEGTFRLDLYHRLAVFPLDVPPLREHMEDLPSLTEHWLGRIAKELPAKQLMPEALDVLHGHHWPGNVRELGHVLERALILSDGSAGIRAEHIRYRRKPRV